MATIERNETLTVEEVAKMLRVSKPTVYEHLRTGAIPGRQLGDRWIIGRAAIETHFGLSSDGLALDINAVAKKVAEELVAMLAELLDSHRATEESGTIQQLIRRSA